MKKKTTTAGAKYISTRNLAIRWGRHIETIRGWIEAKKLPGVFIGGRWQVPMPGSGRRLIYEPNYRSSHA